MLQQSVEIDQTSKGKYYVWVHVGRMHLATYSKNTKNSRFENRSCVEI